MTAFHDENVFIANIDETSVQKHWLHGWLVVLSLPFELLPFELAVLLPCSKNMKRRQYCDAFAPGACCNADSKSSHS